MIDALAIPCAALATFDPERVAILSEGRVVTVAAFPEDGDPTGLSPDMKYQNGTLTGHKALVPTGADAGRFLVSALQDDTLVLAEINADQADVQPMMNVTNVTMVSAGTIPSPAAFAFRRDKWTELSTQERQTLLDAAPMAVVGALFGMQGSGVSALERPGVEFNVTEASADLQALIDEAVEAQVESAVQTASDAGVEDAQVLVDRYLAAYDRWQGLVTDVDTQEAYAQLLRDEIYSKIEVE